jgi:hypothetical protein
MTWTLLGAAAALVAVRREEAPPVADRVPVAA